MACLSVLRWLNTVLAVCESMSFAKSWQEKGCSSQSGTDKLLTTLGENLPSERTQAEEEILQTLAESYSNATHWSTRRQILSILADKLSLKELTHYIPGVTPYRFNITRHHRLLHGNKTCHLDAETFNRGGD